MERKIKIGEDAFLTYKPIKHSGRELDPRGVLLPADPKGSEKNLINVLEGQIVYYKRDLKEIQRLIIHRIKHIKKLKRSLKK